MPIYAYKCGSCGHAKDVLQKVSDQPLSVCPACGAEAFSKQVTAAGFQLKGSGWYVTDFRNGSSAGTSSTASSTAPASTASSTPAAEPAKSGGDTGGTTGGKSDGPTASAGCGGGCACH